LAALTVSALWGVRVVRQAWSRDEALKASQYGDFAGAEPRLKIIMDRDPSDVDALRALVQGYLRTERGREADAYLARWCALRPHQAEPHEQRVALMVAMKRLDQAIAECERVLEIDADRLPIQQQLAMLLMLDGRHVEAERACRGFLQRRPGQSGLLYFLAQACYWQGKDQEARTILDPLLQSQPRYADALVLRGILFCESEQDQLAIPLLRRALTEAPGNRLGRYHLSQALTRTGQTAAAQRELAELLRQGDGERAREDLKLQPDNIELQIKAAEVRRTKGLHP
jgi:predicted Zn-dependent protease